MVRSLARGIPRPLRRWGLIAVLVVVCFIGLINRHIYIHITVGGTSPEERRLEMPVEWGVAHVGLRPESLVYYQHKPPQPYYDKEKEKALMDQFQFNKYLSDRTPLNRHNQDARHATCKKRLYPSNMPAASVILVFYNEAASVVLRTVYSILNKSPEHLIHEVLLYDDDSDLKELKEGSWFVEHIATLPKVRIERSSQGRGGLIKAKNRAGRLATGEVLVYLDCHCECNDGWLEPLLYPIYLNRTACTTPTIDTIAWEDLKVYAPPLIESTGGLNWILNMLWSPLSEREQKRRSLDPYPRSADILSPTMAGGLFAIDRLWFYQLGMYDDGQDIWGGENIDLSFRVWLCGGQQWMSPCSKVAHVFRPKHPYTFGNDNFNVVMKNYKRNALVWFDDEQLEFFYRWKPQAIPVDAGDVSARLEFNKKNNCRNFNYFLTDVWPALPSERDCLATGEIKGTDNICLDNAASSDTHGQQLGCYGCHNMGNNQFWMYKKDRRIMGLLYVFEVLGTTPGSTVNLVWADLNSDKQLFDYNPQTGRLVHRVTGLCVDRDEKGTGVVVDTCNSSKLTQRWYLQYTYPDRPL